MHNSITAHCNLEKISFKVILYQKKKSLLGENYQFILSSKHEDFENFSSACLTLFDGLVLSGFDNFAQYPMFTIGFCKQIDLLFKYLF